MVRSLCWLMADQLTLDIPEDFTEDFWDAPIYVDWIKKEDGSFTIIPIAKDNVAKVHL